MASENSRINIWDFRDENYGPFLPFVNKSTVTDINYNGRDTWIDDLELGRYKAEIEIPNQFVEEFTAHVRNAVNQSFNMIDNLLEAETETLRISIIHESVTNSGRSISIRKTEPVRRLTDELIRETHYCTKEMAMFLQNAVKAHLNIIMCGLPGSGKTELLKYLTQYIPAHERVITIEDNLEIHYSDINPGSDSIELKVNEDLFDYTKAIKACLRQNPMWIMLSEARSTEIRYLLESLSTGTHCLTTLHTDDVRKVPDRIQNMMKDSYAAARMENDIYSFINVGVLLNKKANGNGVIRRYIDQICIFTRDIKNNQNSFVMVAEDGKIKCRDLPADIVRKFNSNNINDPFFVKGGYPKWD